METVTLDAATRTAAGGESMSWPEAFTTAGIVMAAALGLYSICRWW
ncbi:hypothetical protein PJS25_004116 [Escherichia coli]|nr:hypothetical protein [Escherichia coli]